MSRAILVTGATGNQGSAVLDELIKHNLDDFTIIALTRNIKSSAAKIMSSKSGAIHVLEGNLDDPEAIFIDARKMTGVLVWGVFMVQSVLAGGVTAAQEEVQGKRFIDSCIANHVKMLVYTSVDRGGVASDQNPTLVSVFASKHRIEQHLFTAATGTKTSWLVLRPTGLMEPLLRDDLIAKISRTSWKIYMKPNRPIQWVSCKDIAYFCRQGFIHTEEWANKCLSLAGWEGTFEEANQVYRQATGQSLPLTFGLLTRFVCGVMVRDLSISYDWYNEKGFAADIGALRKLHPGLLGLENFLRDRPSA